MNKTEKRTVSYIPLTKLHEFKDHPYRVVDDAEMEALAESVSRHGILSPIIVRRMGDAGDEYEIISGHRRTRAAEKAGIHEVPAFVMDMSRDEAVIALVDANLNREHILPSEKAYAYKMKMDAMKHQGRTSDQVGPKLTAEELSESDSATQVKRYIRLTYLLQELLALVDEGRIALTPAVELSYLTPKEQYDLLETIESEDCTPSLSQASRMKKLSQAGNLDMDAIFSIMTEEKANQKEKIIFRCEDIRAFFPRNYTALDMQKSILRMMQAEHERQLRRMRDRDAR